MNKEGRPPERPTKNNITGPQDIGAAERRSGRLSLRALSEVQPRNQRRGKSHPNELLEEHAFRLLLKFHKETDCGKHGDHWSECDALVDAFGWSSWETWHELLTGRELT